MPLSDPPPIDEAQPGPNRQRPVVPIGLAIMAATAVYWLLPLHNLPEGLDPASVRLGLALLTLIGGLWISEALPLAFTALMVPFLASATGLLDVRSAFSNFAHPLIFLFLAGFGLAAALLKHGLDRWLAFRVVRLARGHFLGSSFLLFTIGATFSMWISNTAAVALLLPVAVGLLRRMELTQGAPARQKATPFVLLGIAYSASVGGVGTLIGTPPNAIAAASLDYDFAEWMRVGIPFVAALLPCLFFLLWLCVHPGNPESLQSVTEERFDLTPARLGTMVVFSLAVVGWLSGGVLSAALGIDAHFDSLVAVAALLLLAVSRLIDWKDLDESTDWGVLILFGGGLTLSATLSASGASRFLAMQLGLVTEALPALLTIGCVVLFVVFLTEVSSNTATAALFVPIFYATALDLGIRPESLVVPLSVACSCAFMLPVATPPNALVFATGEVPQRTMMRVGLRLNLAFAVVVTLLSWFLV